MEINTNEARFEFNIRDIFRIIWIRKWLVMLAFIIVAASTAYYNSRLIPIYRASATLMQETLPVPTNIFQGLQFVSTPNQSIKSQMRYLKSSYVLEPFEQKLNEDYGFNLTAKQISDSVSLRPISEANFFAMSATFSDPEVAMVLANAFAELYVTKTAEIKRADTEQAIKFLSEQMQMYYDKLMKAEDNLEEFKRKQGITSISPEDSSLGQQLNTLETQLSATQVENVLAETRYSLLKQELAQRNKSMVPSATGDLTPQIRLLQQRLVDKESALAALEEKGYTDKHPQVAMLKGERDALRAELQEELGKLIKAETASIDPFSQWQSLVQNVIEQEIQLRAVEEKEKYLAALIKEFKDKHPEFVSTDLELRRLNRTVSLFEQTYMLLVEKYENIRVGQAMESPGVRVVDRATKPNKPIGPNKNKNLIFGCILGLALGLGIVFLLEFLDDTIKTPADVERYLELPTVGTIPKIIPVKLTRVQREELQNSLSSQQPAIAALPNIEETSTAENNPTSNPTSEQSAQRSVRVRKRKVSSSRIKRLEELLGCVISNHPQKSHVAEAYRTLRTNLQFADVDEEPKMIVITSPGPGEGKSLTLANLAITIASSGVNTLLIDTDLRRPRQHRIFQADKKPGLTELLADNLPRKAGNPSEIVDDADTQKALLSSFIKPTHQNNLSLLTSGSSVPNPTELLASEKMKQIVETVSSEFDMVLCDSPPIIGLTDAAILASEADTTMFIIQAGKTKRQVAMHAKQILKNIDADIFGVIINEIDYAKQYGYYYYRRYYYSYYYSHDDEGDEL